MLEDIPRYRGDESKCAKCLWPEASVEYIPADYPSNFMKGMRREDRHDQDGDPWPEHAFLKRTCGECGWSWAEMPMDMVPSCDRCAGSGQDPYCGSRALINGELAGSEPDPCHDCQGSGKTAPSRPTRETGRCESTDGVSRCELAPRHVGVHRYGGAEWFDSPALGQCDATNTGDRCELVDLHSGDHRLNGRVWVGTDTGLTGSTRCTARLHGQLCVREPVHPGMHRSEGFGVGGGQLWSD